MYNILSIAQRVRVDYVDLYGGHADTTCCCSALANLFTCTAGGLLFVSCQEKIKQHSGSLHELIGGRAASDSLCA